MIKDLTRILNGGKLSLLLLGLSLMVLKGFVYTGLRYMVMWVRQTGIKMART